MNWPPPLDGNSALHRWLNRDQAAAKAGMPLSSKDVLVERTPDGSRFTVKFPPPPNRPFFHPFKIYNVPHPTDKSLSPFTFAIHPGYVGYRPRNTDPTFGVSNSGYFFEGNYEYRERCNVAGFDGTMDTVSEDCYSATTKAQLASVETVELDDTGDFGVSDLTKAGRFVIKNTSTLFSGPAAAFWIEIDDNNAADLATIKVKARMFGENANTLSRSTSPFPSASGSIIQLGIVEQDDGAFGVSIPTNPGKLAIRQLVYDHQVNRYPRGALTAGLAGLTQSAETPMFYLGEWDDAVHKDTYMYPGDCVTVDNVIAVDGGAGTVTTKGLYVAATIFKATAAPPGTGWILAAG